MSGSPILQDGKFAGAVTHVLLNDPSKGYGILMETMLAAGDFSEEPWPDMVSQADSGAKHFASRRPGIFYNTDLPLSAREFLRLDSGFGLRLELRNAAKLNRINNN